MSLFVQINPKTEPITPVVMGGWRVLALADVPDLHLTCIKKNNPRAGHCLFDRLSQNSPMNKKPTYEALEQRVKELEKEKKETQQMEAAFFKRQKYLESVFHYAPDAIVTLDPSHRILDWNPGAQIIFGYTHEEAYGKDLDQLVSGPDVAQEANDNTRKVLSGEILKPVESVRYGKNGTPVHVIASGAPIMVDHVLMGAVALYTDITNLNQAKEEKIHLEKQLKHAQKMESIGTLTNGIAHDFNNIMGIILGNTELALNDIPEGDPAYSNLEEIRTASLRASNIVGQLLSFSRKTDQNLHPIEIARVVQDVLKLMRSTIPTTIEIHQDIQLTDETILADPTQINQIMMNLCINASHAMEETGGTLGVVLEEMILDDNSGKNHPDLKRGRYVRIMVTDTGPGIDPEIIDRIFDPYFTTKGVGKGSGMGLAVVLGIVKNHGGAITVESSLGRSTRFSVLLPLAQGKAAQEAETIQEIPRGSETLLVVDDEISIVTVMQKMFQHLGYKVETATTPQDALDRFQSNPHYFDLVITDMTMPQMTGVKLSEKLMDIRPDIPIIICTGHSALVDEKKAKELKLAAYLMKPIHLLETARIIRNVLDKKIADSDNLLKMGQGAF